MRRATWAPLGGTGARLRRGGDAVVDLEGDVFAVAVTGVLESRATRAWVGVEPSPGRMRDAGEGRVRRVSAVRMGFIIWRRSFFLVD